jgi:stage II sporulation protein E
MSHILAEAVEEQREDFDRAEDAEARVRLSLEKMGLYPDALFVYCQRRKYICARGIDVSRTRTDAESLRMRLEQACGCALEDPLLEFYGGNGRGRLSMTLTTRRRYTAERACLTAAAEGEGEGAICGDSVCMFENNRDYFYALISDGMGTGGGAAFNSGVCSLFLEKMLMAGNRTATVLRMINGVLRSKGGARQMESSATVDLLELDLLTGRASIVKSGAAPTFIVREGRLYKLASRNLPLGIIKELDTKRLSFEIAEGDIIVMVSDGVTAGSDEAPWLSKLLKENAEKEPPKRICELISERAKLENESDDISVSVIKIEKNK